jgi:hypothetical protein
MKTLEQLLELFGKLDTDAGLWPKGRKWVVLEWFEWDLHTATEYHEKPEQALEEYLKKMGVAV